MDHQETKCDAKNGVRFAKDIHDVGLFLTDRRTRARDVVMDAVYRVGAVVFWNCVLYMARCLIPRGLKKGRSESRR